MTMAIATAAPSDVVQSLFDRESSAVPSALSSLLYSGSSLPAWVTALPSELQWAIDEGDPRRTAAPTRIAIATTTPTKHASVIPNPSGTRSYIEITYLAVVSGPSFTSVLPRTTTITDSRYLNLPWQGVYTGSLTTSRIVNSTISPSVTCKPIPREGGSGRGPGVLIGAMYGTIFGIIFLLVLWCSCCARSHKRKQEKAKKDSEADDAASIISESGRSEKTLLEC